MAESENFVVVPSVGSLVAGWLLVVPKDHVLNLSRMPPTAHSELAALRERLLSEWEPIFGSMLAFEHGPVETLSPTGCGIDHAHLHLVPYDFDRLVDGARALFPDLLWRESRGYPTHADGPYLYVAAGMGGGLLATGSDIPSQAFRQVIASQQGRADEYDWKTHRRMDVLRQTLGMAPGC